MSKNGMPMAPNATPADAPPMAQAAPQSSTMAPDLSTGTIPMGSAAEAPPAPARSSKPSGFRPQAHHKANGAGKHAPNSRGFK